MEAILLAEIPTQIILKIQLLSFKAPFVVELIPPSLQGQQAGATPPPCRAMAQCFSNDECGEKGRCFGIAVGTCDCSACLQSALCLIIFLIKNIIICLGNLGDALGQPQCGGLKNACNETSNLCNCDAAYQQAGFNNFGDAVLKFCSKQQCDGKKVGKMRKQMIFSQLKDSCFGLPCHAGHCLCV